MVAVECEFSPQHIMADHIHSLDDVEEPLALHTATKCPPIDIVLQDIQKVSEVNII